MAEPEPRTLHDIIADIEGIREDYQDYLEEYLGNIAGLEPYDAGDMAILYSGVWNLFNNGGYYTGVHMSLVAEALTLIANTTELDAKDVIRLALQGLNLHMIEQAGVK